jgi:hypothetical protein
VRDVVKRREQRPERCPNVQTGLRSQIHLTLNGLAVCLKGACSECSCCNVGNVCVLDRQLNEELLYVAASQKSVYFRRDRGFHRSNIHGDAGDPVLPNVVDAQSLRTDLSLRSPQCAPRNDLVALRPRGLKDYILQSRLAIRKRQTAPQRQVGVDEALLRFF